MINGTLSMAKTGNAIFRRSQAWLGAGIVGALALGCIATPARSDDWIIGEAQASPAPRVILPVGSQNFSIPAQALITALDSYGAATGVQIFYSSRLAANRHSPGAVGTLTPEAALRSLLTGTGLSELPTGYNAITLVLDPRGIPLHSVLVSPILAPTLSLETMHVAPPPAGNFRLYASTVQFAILSALQHDEGLKSHSYHASLDIWLTPDGGVSQSQVSYSGGDSGLDGAIAEIVRKVTVGESPPFGLPQPIHIRVLAAGRP